MAAIAAKQRRGGSVYMCYAAALALAGLFLGAEAYGQAADRTIFVANNGNLEGSVTALAVREDGTLSIINRIITGSRPDMNHPCPGCNPYEIAITPNGRYLATGHASTNDPLEQITIFEVAGDGSIAEILAQPVPGTPMDVVWLSDELLAAERTDSQQVAVYRFTPQPPALAQVDVKFAGEFSTYLAKSPSGSYLYASDSSSGFEIRTFRVEANGTLTLIETENTGSYYPLEMAVSHDGTKLYSAGGITQVELGYLIAADGTLSPMAGSPFPAIGDSPSNVYCSGDDRFLLVGHGRDATVRTFSIDQASGAITYTGHMFDVGLQGTLGDVSALDDLFFVTDNSTADDGAMGVYSFTLHDDGSFTQNGPILSTQGIGPRSIAVWRPPLAPGDLNCDGRVDNFDISPFVLALVASPPEYAEYYALYPNCDRALADINGDGNVDNFDISPFVELLSGAN